VKLFRERGKRITPSVAERLVELVGRDLRRLDVEAEKLAAYVGEAPDVSATDLASAATADGTTTVYELTDAVGDRDVERALRLLGSLLGSGETALGLVAMLVRHVRALIGALALAARGLGVDAMAPELGMAPWQARNAARQASKWEPTELSNALCGLAAVEEEMKTSPTDAGLVLERWVISTMRPADSR
jgi:DNA polymerase III subunit delta